MLSLSVPDALSTLAGHAVVILFGGIPAAVAIMIAWFFYLEHRRDRVCILLYHRLLSRARASASQHLDREMIYVTYDTAFAEQMAYLDEAGFTTLTLDDYVAVRTGSGVLPEKPIIITFDDGYESNYLYAYPVLKARHQKATIFVAPEPDEHTREIVAGIDGFLAPEQMREMTEHGISIQSHTLSHCVLCEMEQSAVMHELDESRRRLSAVTGKPVEHIAIPRAGYSRRVKDLVRRAGYRTACANAKGSANGRADLLNLPRLVVERDMSIEEFKNMLTPRGTLAIRLVGNIKRIPERIAGPRCATALRNLLYRSLLRPLFQARNLKRTVLVGVILYVLGAAWVFTRWIGG